MFLIGSACSESRVPENMSAGAGAGASANAGTTMGGSGGKSSSQAGSTAATAGTSGSAAGGGAGGMGGRAAGGAGASGTAGGAAGAGEGGTGLRPDAGSTMDPWPAPPIEDGEAKWSDNRGWGDTDATLCDAKVGAVRSHSIYSHGDDVYVAVSVDCNSFAESCSGGKQGRSVYRQDKKGWEEVYSDEVTRADTVGRLGVRAFPNGTIVVFGELESCGMVFIKGGTSTCVIPDPVVDVFVVNDALAYAAQADRVLAYDGTDWSPLGAPLEPASGVTISAIWASEDLVIAAANAQQIYYKREGDAEFQRYTGVPAGDYVSVWAFGPDDVWAGSSGTQLVHYDGESWSAVWTAQMCRGGGVAALWGAEGEVYFTTAQGLFRQAGSTTTTIADWGCQSPIDTRALWGNSLEEVFIAISDEQGYACGEAIAVWYDGNELHQI